MANVIKISHNDKEKFEKYRLHSLHNNYWWQPIQIGAPSYEGLTHVWQKCAPPESKQTSTTSLAEEKITLLQGLHVPSKAVPGTCAECMHDFPCETKKIIDRI